MTNGESTQNTMPAQVNDLNVTSTNGDNLQSALRSSSGWDGKLRVDRSAVITNPDALEHQDSDHSDDLPQTLIPADSDLLDDEDPLTEDIDLVHCRITSIQSLDLSRFTHTKRLCLRQNAIQSLDFPDSLRNTLEDLDLYDNLIKYIQPAIESYANLKSLDLSFNKIKHIQNIRNLPALTDLYFVSNRVSKIENLDSLTSLTMLELAANRIRELEGLDALTNLRELWLGKNKITEIRNISHLKQLRLLDIKNNRLTKIDGLDQLPGLEELYISHNALEEIGDGLRENKKLRVLDVSSNRITHITGLDGLSELEEFWASGNEIGDFREVERQLGDKKALETVYFEHNPLQSAAPALYRNKIRLALPQVKQIDATYVRV